ncbi:MAG: ABC transporter substrate-binding protein [Alphaproteobacteria bacterium]|nr:ABC transporter substrate-binding protein [Alphaproteobacteria bacterium]
MLRKQGELHPHIPEMADQLRHGKIDRREFLRTATLLGMSAGAAYAMAGSITGEAPIPQAAAAGKKGGTLRFAMRVQEMTDPATFSWAEMSNQARHIGEFLTITGPDNITRPYLAESWSASEDLKTWEFKLRKGVKWSNGDDFTADDVVFNFTRWLDPKTGSSNIGLFATMVEEVGEGDNKTKKMVDGAVEKVDDHTVRLNLRAPELAMPENLYNYPTMIMHRDFEQNGADLSKWPVGTGPYELVEYKVGESVRLRRREGYWGPEPYLDEIHYIDLGEERAAWVAAIASGQVDAIYEVDISQLAIFEQLPNTKVIEAKTAQTAVARFQISQAPFDNKKLRQAFAAAVDTKQLLQLAYQGRGFAGEHHHVCPIHPEYFELDFPARDIAKSKRLLAEAGYPDGVEISIDYGNTTGPWEQAAVQAMAEQVKEAGIDLKLNPMPSSQYWEVWDSTPFGLTSWTHRPLGVMVLKLGYISGVPWNETHYANPEFDQALEVAGGILDVEERRKAMEKVQAIIQDDAVITQPLWRSVFSAASINLENIVMHPTNYHQFNEVYFKS